jgi:ATP-binding cassette subfamily B protein
VLRHGRPSFFRTGRGGSHTSDTTETVVSLARIWELARRQRRGLAILIGSIFASAVVSSVSPLLYKFTIDEVLPQGEVQVLHYVGASLALLAVADAALSVVKHRTAARLGEAVLTEVRLDVFRNLQQRPLAFHLHSRTGAIASRLTGELMVGHHALTETFYKVLDNVFGVVVPVAFMLALDWRLTLLALAVGPVFIIGTRQIRGRLRRAKADQLTLLGEMSAEVTERFTVGAVVTAAVFGDANRDSRAFRTLTSNLGQAGVSTATFISMFHGAFTLVAASAIATIYWAGGLLTLRGTIPLGTLIAFAAYTLRLYGPMESLAVAREVSVNARLTLGRIFELLDFGGSVSGGPVVLSPSSQGPGSTSPLRNRDVIFDGVWFRYPTSAESTLPSLASGKSGSSIQPEPNWVLRDVTMTLKAGATTGLVGASGQGKTTIGLLLLRLYDPTLGCIRMGEEDLRSLDLRTVRSAIGLVPQESHFFHASLRENLLYSAPDATDATIRRALDVARVAGVVDSLPDGLDTIIGEGGYSLSGGERQRLAIARVVLKDPAVIVLDEATAHLDRESERLVQAAIGEAFCGRTVLVISHHPSALQYADEVYRLDSGSVIRDHDGLP